MAEETTARSGPGPRLHLAALGQRCNADGGASRERLIEVVLHDGIHGREIAEVRQEYRQLHDVVQVSARGLGHGGEVVEHAARARLKVAVYDLHRGGVERNLPGQEYEAVGVDRLGVGAYGGGRVICVNRCFGHEFTRSGLFFRRSLEQRARHSACCARHAGCVRDVCGLLP